MILFRKLLSEDVHVFCRFNSSLKPKQVDYCVFLYFQIWTVNRCRWKSGVFSQALKSKVFFSLSPSWMWWQPCPTAAPCSPPHCAVCIFSCSASCDVDGGKTHNNKAPIYSRLSLLATSFSFQPPSFSYWLSISTKPSLRKNLWGDSQAVTVPEHSYVLPDHKKMELISYLNQEQTGEHWYDATFQVSWQLLSSGSIVFRFNCWLQ